MIVDRSLLPLPRGSSAAETDIEHVFVVEDSYEELLAGASPGRLGATPSSTRTRRRRCATRAGRPAGRRASSTRTARRCCTRSASASRTRSGIGVFEGDAILPVVPMFHANAWGYPYLATMFGAKIVYPGPHLDPESLLDDFVAGGRHVGGRRADDLDGDPRDARREPGALGPLEDEGHARRRLGRAARDDRRRSSSGTG